MSHYTTLDTAIVSPQHLLEALADLDFREVECHDTPQPLVGWKGDERADRAEFIIRRRHIGPASNDIGFARRPDGRYEAIISEYDRRAYGPQWLGRLTQRYAYRVAREALAGQDFELVEEQMDAQKTIHMTVRRMA